MVIWRPEPQKGTRLLETDHTLALTYYKLRYDGIGCINITVYCPEDIEGI